MPRQLYLSAKEPLGVFFLPMKFLRGREPRACFQAAGQAIRTVLCFIPPSPAAWMSMEKPSRRLEVTTTWEKPFVFSAVMAAFKFCKRYHTYHLYLWSTCEYNSRGKVLYNKHASLITTYTIQYYTISHKTSWKRQTLKMSLDACFKVKKGD